MYSIYHFWKHLVIKKSLFSDPIDLADFPFDDEMLSCRNKGVFPDLAIKINKNRSLFTGGELIELKDSRAYIVSSFNSTVPTGTKNIRKLIRSTNRKIFKEMRKAGDDVFSLEEREVYYLVRGHDKKEHQKICLVHGSFFETISAEELISKSFAQVLNDRLESTENISQEVKDTLETMFSQQEDFSKVRHVKDASVSLRFRVMTEVNPEGNILDPKLYSKIKDDTLNLVVPFHSEEERSEVISKMQLVMGQQYMEQIDILNIKHLLNGWFVVFQTKLLPSSQFPDQVSPQQELLL
jgi:flagellar hook-basal body complex protein FliE